MRLCFCPIHSHSVTMTIWVPGRKWKIDSVSNYLTSSWRKKKEGFLCISNLFTLQSHLLHSFISPSARDKWIEMTALCFYAAVSPSCVKHIVSHLWFCLCRKGRKNIVKKQRKKWQILELRIAVLKRRLFFFFRVLYIPTQYSSMFVVFFPRGHNWKVYRFHKRSFCLLSLWKKTYIVQVWHQCALLTSVIAF